MYNNLDDILLQKEAIRKQIAEKEEKISRLWDETFHQEEQTEFLTPSQRILKYANTGLGLFDGAMLGWKLYRRLGGGRKGFGLFGKRRR